MPGTLFWRGDEPAVINEWKMISWKSMEPLAPPQDRVLAFIDTVATPSDFLYHRLLPRLDVEQVEAALAAWVGARRPADDT